MNPRNFLLIASFVIVAGLAIISIALLVELRLNESRKKLISSWIVKAININDKSLDLQNLKSKGLAFYEDNKMLFPKFKGYEGKAPLTFSEWYYKRINFIDGQITIKDINQNIFSGTYDIELFDFRDPQIIRLHSDSIEIYLQSRGRFTINNTTIDAFDFDD